MPLVPHRSWTPLVVLALSFLSWDANAQTFTPVASAAIGAHVSFSLGATWVDADGDGDLDLFVVTGFVANNNNVYYRNDGGVFISVTGVALVQDAADSPCSTWADYDNDGDLDAFVSNFAAPGGMLYEGHGGGALTLNTSAGIGGASLTGAGCAWGDYDSDGNVDLIVAVISGQNHLFHNNGNGTFTEVTMTGVTTFGGNHHHPTWADYDGDGDLDLFFATGPVGSTGADQMFRNQLVETGTATFTQITTGVIATDARDSQTLSWVDYDNDGDLDLYAINYTSVPNQLYRNDGGGVFTKIVSGAIVTDAGAAHGVTWGDFDDDGDLDVYVARDLSQNNRYYQNQGDGTFTSVTTGNFVNEGRSNYGVTAGDYDGDGHLDLFVPTARSEAASVLYRNDASDMNHWLIVRLRGTASNRSAIGAKVRVKATIAGVPRWQMREIGGGGGYGGPNALEAHFGLGDATVADTVRIEWPSGLVEIHTAQGRDRIAWFSEALAPTAVGGVGRAALTLACEPNPVAGASVIRWSLPREMHVALAIYDSSGRRVLALADGVMGAGAHEAALAPGALTRAGIYLARLSAGGQTITRRLVRLR